MQIVPLPLGGQMICKSCAKPIDTYDVGAYRKFVDKYATEYACRKCLANHLGWSSEYLDELILMYSRRGCMLFPPMGE